MKNSNGIWRTYGFILIVSMLSAMLLLYLNWNQIQRDARSEIKYANNLVSRSTELLLQKNESFLRIIGERLIELGAYNQSNLSEAQELINKELADNQELAGFGLATITGELFLTSSSIDQNKLPNLLEQPETRESFIRALNEDKLILGRTLYLEALNQWLIPIRHRLTDNKGKVLGVMASAFKLDSPNNIWSNYHFTENQVKLSIVRKDMYRQYTSNISKSQYEDEYSNPFPLAYIEQFDRNLKQQTGNNIEEFKTQGKVTLVEAEDLSGEYQLYAITYNPIHELFIFTAIPMKILYTRLLSAFSWIFILLIWFNIILYFLFRINSRLHKSSEVELAFQARHDLLTNLPNQRYLVKKFKQWQNQNDGIFSILFIDLDNFKSCNDLHGHSVGDKILQEVANRIRKSFISGLNIRRGGDEFTVLLKDTSRQELERLCQEFNTSLSKPMFINNSEFSIRASIGISNSPTHGTELEELLRKADMAMYEAKRLKCNVFFYSNELEQRTERIADIEKELNNALQKNEFSLVYQPQVDAINHEIIGIEALLRWNNENLGNVPPDEFIPLAESTGLIIDIGYFVIETAMKETLEVCQAIKATHDKTKCLPNKFRISINISVRQLLSKGFYNSFNSLLKQNNLGSVEVMLEVTESLFIEDLNKARSILELISQLNVGISLDDFGTGYSSLSVLNKLPISELKIDKSFVQDILTSTQDRQLIQSIINLSKSLNVPVIAEGVENGQQAKFLAEYGCDLFQGYHFSKPIDKLGLIELLERKIK